MGSATIEGRIDMGEKVVINIKTFVDGHRPPDRVLPSQAARARPPCVPSNARKIRGRHHLVIDALRG